MIWLVRSTSGLLSTGIGKELSTAETITYRKFISNGIQISQRSVSSLIGSLCQAQQQQQPSNVCKPPIGLLQFKRHKSYDEKWDKQNRLTTFNELQRRHIDINEIQTRVLNVCSKYDEIDSSKLTLESHSMEDLGLDLPNHVEIGKAGLGVYVCQPWVQFSEYNFQTEPELQLAECISLCNTVPNWKVAGNSILYAQSINRADIVGEKMLEDLKLRIKGTPNISAIFFGVEVLSGIQMATLERELELPVYDRFTVVLNIFRHHAKTKEAKLQIALAEIPYIRSHLRQIHESAVSVSGNDHMKSLVGGSGDTYYHKRLSILRQREVRINQLLVDLKYQRDLMRKSRMKNNVPTISIVGYTNSGKTSLIKAITEDKRLKPKDQLFATLDVTAHTGTLPSSQSVIFLDTVGFISRTPKLLIEAFEATLAEVKDCDLLVHVLDINHPDHKLQRSTVIKALQSMSMPKSMIKSMLTVGNKYDLAEGSVAQLPSCDLLVSMKTGHNINALVKLIDEKLCQGLGKRTLKFRILTGDDNYIWLRTNASMKDQDIDEKDLNYTICKVTISKAELGKYKKRFGSDTILPIGETIVEDSKSNKSNKSYG